MISERYERQLLVIGEKGQEKLANASVLVVGAGGLGSAAITYLAAAGVGRIGIVDGDIVEESNLQRQIIHGGRVGENKAESAAEFVESLNPDVVVDVYPYRLTPENALKIIEPYDVVVGCPDNFRTRYIISDACSLLRKPFVHAAVYAWEGELAVFSGSPCYRCYLPRAPDEHGRAIIGSTAGVFGCLQASEVIKIVTGCGNPLIGQVFRLDLKSFESLKFRIRADPECAVCNGELRGIFRENYEGRCEIRRLE